jgi:hypothetical protein
LAAQDTNANAKSKDVGIVMVKAPAKNEPTQFGRFLETARALGCDEDKEQFEAKLGKIATAKAASAKKERTKK